MGSALSGALIWLATLLVFTTTSRVWVDREAVVMGTRLKVRVEAPTDVEADRVIDRVFDTVVSLDRKWTTWEAGSELAAVRIADLGVPVSLSDDTFEMLAQAWHLADRTDGAFDPAVGSLLDAWDARGDRAQPAATELERALASVGRRCFDLSPASRTLTRHCPDAWIDEGGFGKGAVLATIAQILDEEAIERARIDFGSQLLLRGSPGGVEPTVRLADPRDPTTAAFEWPVSGGSFSFATTSQGDRRFSTPEGEKGTVVDPRTGLAVADWGSVTVRSDDPLEADALATALFVMGPRDGVRWLAARPTVDAVFLVVDDERVPACGRERILQELVALQGDASVSTAALLTSDLRSCST